MRVAPYIVHHYTMCAHTRKKDEPEALAHVGPAEPKRSRGGQKVREWAIGGPEQRKPRRGVRASPRWAPSGREAHVHPKGRWANGARAVLVLQIPRGRKAEDNVRGQDGSGGSKSRGRQEARN